ncbi:MAG: MCP four helix bundle domain-containing protein [Betaproteobacteria bacterium]|nr:MCP four helix bundle domain-containing protein [Betaproteobacteria bacterium]
MNKTPTERRRWIAPASALGLLLLALVALFMRINATPPGSQDRVDRCLQRLEIARQLQSHAQGASVPLVQLLVAPDRDTRVPLYQRIDAANAAAEVALNELTRLTILPEERASLDQLIAKRARYDERYTEAVEEIELAGAKGALEQFWASTRAALSDLESTTAHLVENETQRLARERAALNSTERDRLWTQLLLLAALLLAAWAGASLVKARRP